MVIKLLIAGWPHAVVTAKWATEQQAGGTGFARTKEWKMPETEPTPSLWRPGGRLWRRSMLVQSCLSDKLSAPRRYICDADLLAVAGMLPARDHVDAVDLQENSNLTDLSLVPLLEQFVKVDRLAEGLRRLNLKYCKDKPKDTDGLKSGLKATWIQSQMTTDLALDLVEVEGFDRTFAGSELILGHSVARYCEDKPVTLMSIGLARVGLGGHMLTKDCLHSLLGVTGLADARVVKLRSGFRVLNLCVAQVTHTLDLSEPAEFQLVGDFIAENLVLEHLLLDHCAGFGRGRVKLRKIRFAQGLELQGSALEDVEDGPFDGKKDTSLSVCTDRIDSRAALVIEDSLEGHPTLKRLYLRNDPLGIMGLPGALVDRGCHGGKSGDEVICLEGSAAQVFSFTNPGGKYVLDLSIPYDRSLCRMLYETAERFELKHSKAFVNINYSIPPYQHPIRALTRGSVRREGILTFTFNVESAIAAKWSEIADDDFITFLNAHLELMRFTPHRIKMRPLLANWKAISGMPMEQETFLTALASDFNMILPYLEYMVQACPEAGTQTLFRLIPSLKRDGSSMYLATALFPEMEDFLVTVREMEAYMLFNPQNPTGHYKLKLENSTDFAVAQQLLLLDRWESVVNKRNRRQDVKMLTEWVIPEFGEFECDYVTSNHPKKGSKPLSDDLWEELMMCMYDSPCEPQDRLKVLKTISHQIFLSSLHIRQMVGFFRNDLDREDALVFFWPRVVDKYNAKVFRVRFEKQEDVVRLQERLGYASFFPFIQPENAKFRYNMAVYEQRLAASLIVTLAQRENPGNIKAPYASQTGRQKWRSFVGDSLDT
ncbi:Replication protein A 70 kDa DNA-binding subunit [Durusdinium trenchii]|uniref:Replication protein A 70 kDa DNA-binding subunit n=1 Tax=Durusdinium trenchii TaxID=1381693 RepID=A0ABP0KBF1_9DINO